MFVVRTIFILGLFCTPVSMHILIMTFMNAKVNNVSMYILIMKFINTKLTRNKRKVVSYELEIIAVTQ